MIINKKQLKPGDLIFYSFEENGELRNISHVAIYVGDGKMVHAANLLLYQAQPPYGKAVPYIHSASSVSTSLSITSLTISTYTFFTGKI